MSDPLLSVERLTTTFAIGGSLFRPPLQIHAVNDVSFSLRGGETLGVVGESGSGKSTLGRSILRLIEPAAGRIVWQGRSLLDLTGEEMRRARRDLQIIFQDPIASLDLRMTVGDIIAEPLTVFEPELGKAERRARVAEIMDAVGLLPEMAGRYPHEFSGGQAQRIGIARALVSRPKLVICDEPVSALDVSIQAQIIMLLRRLRAEFDLTLIFISHDLAVVRLISDRILVLYLGKVVELGPTAQLFAHPAHPYTKALISAAPIPDPDAARSRGRVCLAGEPPSSIDPPPGCVFSSRCWKAAARCREAMPDLREIAAGRSAACYFPETDTPLNREG
ncbi:MAG TPA: oligopeptide/dipeptide ABC transporter ATP-binding protein [Hyphomicrobiales bacterium]